MLSFCCRLKPVVDVSMSFNNAFLHVKQEARVEVLKYKTFTSDFTCCCLLHAKTSRRNVYGRCSSTLSCIFAHNNEYTFHFPFLPCSMRFLASLQQYN